MIVFNDLNNYDIAHNGRWLKYLLSPMVKAINAVQGAFNRFAPCT